MHTYIDAVCLLATFAFFRLFHFLYHHCFASFYRANMSQPDSVRNGNSEPALSENTVTEPANPPAPPIPLNPTALSEEDRPKGVKLALIFLGYAMRSI